ncbi:hypothetical protein [Actinosynnema sp. NPDC020468]|uniref:hypothetical protein n=1 Tax=Actinosynnema sp. NPDC020468 TaxID=3154488 RepID=UPI0034024732
MSVVVLGSPEPGWFAWRPGADRSAAVRAATVRARRRVGVWVAGAGGAAGVVGGVLVGGAVGVPVGIAFFVVAAVVSVALILLLPVRVSEWDVVLAGSAGDVVHSDEFFGLDEQRRRGRRLCESFLAARGSKARLDPVRVGQVEVLLWRVLFALRDSLTVRRALRQAVNREGLSAAIAESTRALGSVDRRVDEFASALRILAEEADPELACAALRRVAALDPL